MKNTGICPKCKSANIFIYKSPVFRGVNVETVWNPVLKLSSFKRADSKRYVCCDCGYSELYFDTKNLNKNN